MVSMFYFVVNVVPTNLASPTGMSFQLGFHAKSNFQAYQHTWIVLLFLVPILLKLGKLFLVIPHGTADQALKHTIGAVQLELILLRISGQT
ncbi:hypothetical protein BDN67DRAFT_928948, partial [Paxillus ammoniavirescens]